MDILELLTTIFVGIFAGYIFVKLTDKFAGKSWVKVMLFILGIIPVFAILFSLAKVIVAVSGEAANGIIGSFASVLGIITVFGIAYAGFVLLGVTAYLATGIVIGIARALKNN